MSWQALPPESEPPGAWWTGRPAADARVYALRVEEAALVEWDLERSLQNVTSWSPARGARTATRHYP